MVSAVACEDIGVVSAGPVFSSTICSVTRLVVRRVLDFAFFAVARFAAFLRAGLTLALPRFALFLRARVRFFGLAIAIPF